VAGEGADGFNPLADRGLVGADLAADALDQQVGSAGHGIEAGVFKDGDDFVEA